MACKAQGISREAAQKALAQWQTTWRQAVDNYAAAKQEAEEKARSAAIAARDYTMDAAAAGFALMSGTSVAEFAARISLNNLRLYRLLHAFLGICADLPAPCPHFQ